MKPTPINAMKRSRPCCNFLIAFRAQIKKEQRRWGTLSETLNHSLRRPFRHKQTFGKSPASCVLTFSVIIMQIRFL